ncbi:MAG: LacI family transcriptional regulator [Erysipelotrichaceae bacterium]|nr:LacI family transcriptional regulator [Erysipelotrichaceae bacterium]
MSKPKISMKEIAKIAGVSTATVSNVINKTGRYSEETSILVNSVIKEYNYVANSAAKSLRISSSHTIGVILPNIINYYFAHITTMIESYFYEKGYPVFICNTANDPEQEKEYFKLLDQQLVDGIICISCQKMFDSNLISRKIPIVLIDRNPVNTMNLPIIRSDEWTATYQATQLLIKKGCKDIIYLNSRGLKDIVSDREQGYLDALSDNNIVYNRNKVIKMQKTTSSVGQASDLILEYLDKGQNVDGVICASDNAAIGTIAGLRKRGFRVPEDVKVTGFDNTFQSEITSPTLTTIERYPELMAKIASQKLYDLIKGVDNDIKDDVVCSIKLIERESTKD